MKKIKLIFIESVVFVAIFIVIVNRLWAAQVEISLPYEDTWKLVVQTMAFEGIKITENDKDTGMVQGEGSFVEGSTYFDCSKVRGRAESYTYKVSALVRKKADSLSIVSIRAEGLVKSFRYRHLIFIRTGRVYKDTVCKSTGELEKKLFQQMMHLNLD